jgi:proteasome assembly chaperone (PAC2) family protein
VVEIIQMVEEVGLKEPALVVGLDGWVNAGSAGTLAAAALAQGGAMVARFDSDGVFDYRMTRPTLEFRNGVLGDVEFPELVIRAVRPEGRDLLVLSGTEPNWNWRRVAADVAELCVRFGVIDYVGIGGVPWAAPHTRPVSVMTTSTSAERIPSAPDAMQGVLRVPGAAVNVIEARVAAAGVPTIGFWARVPNYVGTDYPQAAVALVERVTKHLGVSIEVAALQREAEEQATQLAAAIDQRPEVRTMVEQLEQAHDTAMGVSGEDLATEIERFLRGEGH